jgi:hypothetical protein
VEEVGDITWNASMRRAVTIVAAVDQLPVAMGRTSRGRIPDDATTDLGGLLAALNGDDKLA